MWTYRLILMTPLLSWANERPRRDVTGGTYDVHSSPTSKMTAARIDLRRFMIMLFICRESTNVPVVARREDRGVTNKGVPSVEGR